MSDIHVDEKGLPEYCFSTLQANKDEVILIKRYEKGYYPAREDNEPWYGEETANIANAERGINKAQRRAMEMGSMFGWEIPGANPALYDEVTGLPKK